MAPRLVAANIAITVSGMLGMKPETLSPGLTPVCFEGLLEGGHLPEELREGHLPDRLSFPLKDEGRLLIAVPEEVLSEVELCPDEPPGPWHLPKIIHHHLVGFGVDDGGEIPEICPELRDVVHRPLIELLVIAEDEAVTPIDELHELPHIGFLYPLP